ncbi:hypothetical protein FIBSPDRAFT_1044484 [Athelia psychrophila]|uniref:Glutathione S-transferase n=1 Tax=Athelia psychrophila TaxID=1759441 RepID=A0A166JIP1_9AGAM|nr:hypothetical protein FIBSPDRAFT_1044484 [Fibularhizoctonia sp. CBS 109695]
MSPIAQHTLVGTPFSTFTRTISLGLHRKDIPFHQVHTAPHSAIADAHHPFGFLPTLIIPGDGKIKLRETQAIVRYIDRVVPEPSLHLPEGDSHFPEQMWEVVSFIAAFGFPKVEPGVVKKRVAAGDEGKISDAEIREQIKEGVAELKHFLAAIESLMAPDGYIFGENLTWADYFLYPLMADLEAIPEGEVIGARIRGWMTKMKALPEVEKTFEKTLAAGGRPPSD